MDFFIYDLSFLILLGGFLAVFLYRNRKNLTREGILFLYKTKLGIKFINYISKKYKKFLNGFEWVLIISAYILMVGSFVLILRAVWMFFNPAFVKAFKIPPILPLIPYIPRIFKVDFLPPFYFTYWIIVLAVTAVFHEFMHGIFAKARDIKIKSTGFAFLGPFIGAFVEPNEKKVEKLSPRKQIGFLTAGSFGNILVAIIFFLILILYFSVLFVPAGAVFSTYNYEIFDSNQIENITNEEITIKLNGGLNLTKVLINESYYYVENPDIEKLNEKIITYEDSPALNAGLRGIIIEMDGKKIKGEEDLAGFLKNKGPGEEVSIKTMIEEDIKEYQITLGENKNKAYLGIAVLNTDSGGLLGVIRNKITFFKKPNTYYQPRLFSGLTIFIYHLFWWMILVNLGVAFFNMLPLGIFDGGRVFYVSILGLTKSKKIAKLGYKYVTLFLLFLFLLITYLWFINTFL